MRQVAADAGVSISTVSNVLNNPQVVAEQTRRRVEEAMARVGYVRNSAARQLRGVPSSMVGAVILDMANPFYGEVTRGIEDRLSEAGCMLMLCSTDAEPRKQREHLRDLEEHGVRGILLSPVDADRAELRGTVERGTPLVLLDHPAPQDLCAAAVDNVLGARLAAQHLLDLGHRRIAFLAGVADTRSDRDRRQGVRQALAARRMSDTAVLDFTLASSGGADAAERAVDHLLAAARVPTAIFCLNDLAALGVLRGLRRHGVRVPQDMSVCGYDDVQFAEVLSPPLTTVRQPKYELGRAAADLLLDEDRPGHRHQETLFRPRLMVRASTAPPPVRPWTPS